MVVPPFPPPPYGLLPSFVPIEAFYPSSILGSQRYSTPTVLSSPPAVPNSFACVNGLPSPPTIQSASAGSPHLSTNSSDSLPENSPMTIVPTTASVVLTYPSVPTNIPPLNNTFQLVPFGPTNALQCQAPNQAVTSISSILPCNQAVYTGSQAMQTCPCRVTYEQRITNGDTQLCTPGVCQLTSAVYPLSPAQIIPQNTNAIYPTLSIAQNVATAWKQSYGMEQVWQSHFDRLFLQYSPHVWKLVPVNEAPHGDYWQPNVDSAKVRFCCENCSHGWTSMKGRVAFWFLFYAPTNQGTVCLKLYGQQCDRCKSGNYEQAMWYPEEVIKVMANIYNRVGEVYYGFKRPPFCKERRSGKPRTPHNSDLCQACKDGVCAERR